MICDIKALFDSKRGKEILNSISRTVKQYEMCPLIKKGVILGLSGGADSVMLLYTLLALRESFGDFKLRAVHVNHMLRGDDADSDEIFCVKLCKSLGIELVTHRINVSKISEESGAGFEETARKIRYEIFNAEAEKLGCDCAIAVAHNATDNLETMIFNMMRGTGITGLAGIKPVRDNIIRPLISVSKRSIVEFLDSVGVKYVTDKTNYDCDYSRNYIRHEILPRLERLSSDPEKMATRVSNNLRDDISFIDIEADKFMRSCIKDNLVLAEKLKKAPKAIFSRIIAKIIGQKTNAMPEQVHIDKIYELIFGDDFEYSLPGNKRIALRGGYIFIEDYTEDRDSGFYVELSAGVNEIPGFKNLIILSDEPIDKNYSNVYKIEICATLPSYIIEDGLYVRNKLDGDSYSYGGITHKLKKLFSDRKIPKDERQRVPVICDKFGILWTPGFGVRNEENKVNRSYIAIATPRNDNNNIKSFYICQRDNS